MRVSANVDYALRATVELAAAPPGPVKGERIATTQGIPGKFLENVLLELRAPMRDVLEETSLADLVERARAAGRGP